MMTTNQVNVICGDGEKPNAAIIAADAAATAFGASLFRPFVTFVDGGKQTLIVE